MKSLVGQSTRASLAVEGSILTFRPRVVGGWYDQASYPGHQQLTIGAGEQMWKISKGTTLSCMTPDEQARAQHQKKIAQDGADDGGLRNDRFMFDDGDHGENEFRSWTFAAYESVGV